MYNCNSRRRPLRTLLYKASLVRTGKRLESVLPKIVIIYAHSSKRPASSSYKQASKKQCRHRSDSTPSYVVRHEPRMQTLYYKALWVHIRRPPLLNRNCSKPLPCTRRHRHTYLPSHECSSLRRRRLRLLDRIHRSRPSRGQLPRRRHQHHRKLYHSRLPPSLLILRPLLLNRNNTNTNNTRSHQSLHTSHSSTPLLVRRSTSASVATITSTGCLQPLAKSSSTSTAGKKLRGRANASSSSTQCTMTLRRELCICDSSRSTPSQPNSACTGSLCTTRSRMSDSLATSPSYRESRRRGCKRHAIDDGRLSVASL